MRYSTLGGGKRMRALLVYSAGQALNAPLIRLDAVAASLECIHAYSLIHDDLPAMDNDDLRRGKATNHIAYDEATAILAGDALLTLAFEIIAAAESELSDTQCREIIHLVAVSAGREGMGGGQMLDIEATGKILQLGESLTIDNIEHIHRCKTGALIEASVLSGALCADSLSNDDRGALQKYAGNLGLAFQIVDDILDVEASTNQLGKPSGSDTALGKSTYPALLGLEESKKLAENLYLEAIASVSSIGDNTQLLLETARFVVKRNY